MWSCLDCAAPPLAPSDGLVGLGGGGGASEACDEADVEDAEARGEVRSARNVVRACDSRPSSAPRLDVEDDDDDVDDDELANDVDEADEAESSSAKRF